MDIKEILKSVDHTLLAQTATYEQIRKICDDGVKFNTASVCVPPYYVKYAKECTNGKLPVCTVIGFPNGYMTSGAKIFEAEEAVRDGADEIDMVINICMLKNGEHDKITREIQNIKKVCGKKILKVIIETCLLTDDEKTKMCEIVTEAGADYIKTSTGFSTGGATVDDIKLFGSNIGSDVKIKASGGIQSIEDAEKLLAFGASRLGTSKMVKLAGDMNVVEGTY